MDENDIVSEIRTAEAKSQKLSEQFPDYPCDRCSHTGGNCTGFRDCTLWRQWFHNRYTEIERMFGVVRNGKKAKQRKNPDRG